ncbi:hypothetical protein [Glycomyces sp. MUSA5-2]|uniref:hypothetical protein n=1 Tax=Glycomyces sp. MUSA5-2 TaxID=2053002 RepID=UPI003008667A
MALSDTFEVVRASLDGLADQETDCIPHMAAVSLWRLHATGRDVPQPVTCEVLRRCLTHLGLQVEVVPVVVRIWRRDADLPMAEYGSGATGGAADDGYFLLVLPGLDRAVDAHLPELPSIAGSELEDWFLQSPFGPLQWDSPFGVNRFDRIVEYHPVPGRQRDQWKAMRPREVDLERLAVSLLAEVIDVLRWRDVWQRLERERWPRLTAMMRAVADARLVQTGDDGPAFVYPGGRTAGISAILESSGEWPIAS